MNETKKTKVVVTSRMDPDLLARAKSAVYWTPGLTLSALMEEALRIHLEKLGKKVDLKALPPAPGPLRMGRPLNMRGSR